MTTTETYDAMVVKAFDAPIDWEDEWGRHTRGQHRDFRGRPYRRGKQRCRYCGARLPANEVLDPIPYRTNKEGLIHSLSRPSWLARWLKSDAPLVRNDGVVAGD